MAQNDELLAAFRGVPRLIGDPPIVLESILAQVENEQRKQVIGLLLDSVAATLEANLKFVQGARSIIAGNS